MSSDSHPERWNTVRYVALMLVLLLGVLLFASGERPTSAFAQDHSFPVVELPTEALTAPVMPQREMPDASSPAAKLDAALYSLAASGGDARAGVGEFALTSDLRLEDGRVQTRVLTMPGAQKAVAEAIAAQGGEVTYQDEAVAELQAWIPVEALERVAADEGVGAIQQPAYLVAFDETAVAAQSEGLLPLNVPAWHNAGQRGAGVKIAIIDGGFTGYPLLLNTDLPATVNVRNFVDNQNVNDVASGTSHGTACAEIIHDIAPQAQLYLLKIATNIDLREAVDYAIAQGVDVISTSLGWYNLTPGDGTGQLADLAAKARANGIIWLTAAGNDRTAHWGGLFNGVEDAIHNFDGAQEVNFFGPGNGTAYQLPAGTWLGVYLRWDDWGVTDEDFALHLVVYDAGRWLIAATSDNPQNGGPGQRPTEELIGTTTADGVFGFAVQRKSGSRPINLEIFAPDVTPLDEYVPERSLANLADAPALLSVGAVNAVWPYAFQEAYSAQGPTNGPGGTAGGGFIKPDLAGYTGVSTATYGGSRFFAGTSASAPHAAGAAALIKGANRSLSADDVRHILQTRAIDAGPSGLDTMFGYGRLYLGEPGNVLPQFDNHVYLPVTVK